jgi:hypothetical protein
MVCWARIKIPGEVLAPPDLEFTARIPAEDSISPLTAVVT